MSVSRSLNPALVAHFNSYGLVKFTQGFKNVMQPLILQKIIDKLELPSKYPDSSKMDIIDIFPGYGVFSSMVNYELKPKYHLLIEGNKDCAAMWKDRITHLENKTFNSEHFEVVNKSGYSWTTYDELTKDKTIDPSFQSFEDTHNQLLIIGNLTSNFGESLFTQWIMCSYYRNWLHKYGKVRMLAFIPQESASKFVTMPGYAKRNRTACKLDILTDTKVIAITEHKDRSKPQGASYDPRILARDQPILLPHSSIIPTGGQVALVEVVPKNIPELDMALLEYIIQLFMYKSTMPVDYMLEYISPGAREQLAPKLRPELRSKQVKTLSGDEYLEIYDVFNDWPFKPTLQETMGITLEEAREV